MSVHYLMGMHIGLDEGAGGLGVSKPTLISLVSPWVGTITRAFVKGDLVDHSGDGFGRLGLRLTGAIPVVNFYLPEGEEQVVIQSGLTIPVIKGTQILLVQIGDFTVDETLGIVCKIETED